ncbi:MAG: type III PLP-dependent enzyme domain-containing protein [Planctomycetota bacterium]|jgi:diaminopimelate decarboxylase
MNYQPKDIEAIQEKLGTPFYILKLDRFEENFRAFLESFSRIYPSTRIAYSYKTNYIPQLCKVANELGGLAEVVSEMEYELALRIGAQPKDIVFNGPYKTFENIETALLSDSIVNLDSHYEIDVLQNIAAAHGEKRFGVGLRVSFLYNQGIDLSRFGFNVENGSFAEAVRKIKRLDNIYINGLHCHFMVPNKSTTGYCKIAKKMIELYRANFATGGLSYIDVGGGFFSPMPTELEGQFEGPVPKYKDYADAIATEFAAFFGKLEHKPWLILEPGIALVADAMDFVARVIDVKPLHGRNLVLVNGSIYDIKPTLNKKNLPMEIVRKNVDENTVEEFDVVGYTCMENDCLLTDAVGAISKGDYVIFKNVGAYTVVLRPPFIRMAPPIVSLLNDKWELVRRAEQLDDVFKSYGVL